MDIFLLITIVLELLVLLLITFKRTRFDNQKGNSTKKSSIVFEEITTRERKKSAKYLNTGLSDAVREEFKIKLLAFFLKNEPYRDANLKLNDIANGLGLSKNQTSQLINQSFNKDFNSFVNEYRIREARKIIESSSYNTIADVYYDAGFNNASSFNSSFKKFTGLTPSQYISKISSGNV